MCQGIGSTIVNGMNYLHDTNCKIENDKLIWSKVPKWFYFGMATSALWGAGGVLTLLGIWHSSSPYISGSMFVFCGTANFVVIAVFAVKRYLRFRAYEKNMREKILNIQNYLGQATVNFENINAKIGECELPAEIIQLIFSYLKTKELVNASQVCKDWNMQSKVDGIWEALGKKKFQNWEKIKLEKPEYTPKQLYIYNSKIKTIEKSIAVETASLFSEDKFNVVFER